MTASRPARLSLLRPARNPFARRSIFLIFCLRYGPLFTRGMAAAPYFCNMIRMSLASCLPSKVRQRRICRRRFDDLPDKMCRLPAGRNNTLPVAVTLKRFFAPLFVFILGIFGFLRFSLGRGG